MRRTLVSLCFGAMLLAGCGADRAASDEGVVTGASVICDGSSGVRLAVVDGGSGQVSPGTAMLTENGWRFLLVEGSCVAWILPSANESLRTLTLSRDQEQRLSSALRLSHLAQLTGPHPGGCPDAPSIEGRFDQQRIYGPECGLPPGDPLSAFIAAFAAQLDELSAVAPEFSGDMRYLVVRDPDSALLEHRVPVRWPLDVSIASVALTQAQANLYMPGGSLRATGDDASRLRAIRTTALSATSSLGLVYDDTVVAGPDGTVYLLYARDAVPLEDDRGLLPAHTF